MYSSTKMYLVKFTNNMAKYISNIASNNKTKFNSLFLGSSSLISLYNSYNKSRSTNGVNKSTKVLLANPINNITANNNNNINKTKQEVNSGKYLHTQPKKRRHPKKSGSRRTHENICVFLVLPSIVPFTVPFITPIIVLFVSLYIVPFILPLIEPLISFIVSFELVSVDPTAQVP